VGLESLRRDSLAELAIRQLHDQIVAGTWPVGSRIPAETELVERLGVGRSTVREAVRALVHSGLLESRQGTGTFVRSLVVGGWEPLVQRATVLDVYEVRQGLEPQAARLAAQRRTEADLALIDATLAQRQRARAERQRPGATAPNAAFVDADLAFHQAVVAAAHNALLTQIFDSFARSALREALVALVDDDEAAERMDGVNDAHVTLAEAIRAGDPDAAVEATEANLHTTARSLRRLIKP
jgi:DNA-binding FadR family transcriptional regulator